MGIWIAAVFMMAASQAVAPSSPPVTSGAPDSALIAVVSVDRIHEGLQRPALKIPAPVEFVPVFRATIDERLFENPLQGMRRELAEDSGYRGKAGVDVLAHAMGVVKINQRSVPLVHRSTNSEGSSGSAGCVLRRALLLGAFRWPAADGRNRPAAPEPQLGPKFGGG